MKKRYLVYVILILVVLSVAIAWFFLLTPFVQPFSGTDADFRTIQLDGNIISVSVADTDATRELGLGGRPGLAQDEGMLFVFPTDGKYPFWMKDMRFPIDMLWLSSLGTVVYMAQDVAPETYPHTFVSLAPARYVLELPAGYAMQHGVNIGDIVQL